MAQASVYRPPYRPQKPPMALRPRWASTNPKRPSSKWHTPRAIGRRHLARPPKSRRQSRLGVRQDQADLIDALRAANPSRWTDAALAGLLGIDVAAIVSATRARTERTERTECTEVRQPRGQVALGSPLTAVWAPAGVIGHREANAR